MMREICSLKRIGYQFDIYSSLLRLFAALESPDTYKATHVSLGHSLYWNGGGNDLGHCVSSAGSMPM